MRRGWTSFDAAATNKELAALPHEDRVALYDAMESYRDGEAGFRLKSYDSGLLMLTDAGRGQARCLFFKVVRVRNEERLLALLFYKKESAKAPKRVIDTARRRMDRYVGEQQ